MKPSDYIKKGYCQIDVAQDANGNHVHPDSPKARKWCLFGAFHKSRTSMEGVEWQSVWAQVGGPPIDWSDTPGRTQAEVIAALEACGL